MRGDVDANVAQHVQLVHLAADAHAEVLTFPELSLTGYELDLAEELAFVRDDRRLDPLRDASADASMTLVVGAPVRTGSQLHIGAFVIAPDRSVELYTKHHLGAFPDSASVDGVVPPAEATVFHPGNRNPLVRLGEHTAAVAVCADVGRPGHAKAAADRGADTYLASMFVIPSEFERETTTLAERAARHGMAVVFANHGGPTGGLAAAGHSAIWSESGALVARLGPSGAGVAIAHEGRDGWHAHTLDGDGRALR